MKKALVLLFAVSSVLCFTCPDSFSGTSPVNVDLAWTDNANNETAYVVERCTGSSCTNFAVRATLGSNATSYRDTSVAKRTAYRYRVKARNQSGDSGYSNLAGATTPSGAGRDAPSEPPAPKD